MFFNLNCNTLFNFREKRLDQESNLIKSQLQSVTDELNKQTSELTKLKKENATKFVTLEAEIAEKTQQLKIAQESIADLKDTNEKLVQKVESTLEKLMEQRKSTDEMFDNFQQELQAQTKLSQLYKGRLSHFEFSFATYLDCFVNKSYLILHKIQDFFYFLRLFCNLNYFLM